MRQLTMGNKHSNKKNNASFKINHNYPSLSKIILMVSKEQKIQDLMNIK